MRILAIETTGRFGSLAALEARATRIETLREVALTGGRTAQILAPELSHMLSDLEWPPASIDLVSVAVGPGSFTGLRIGVTTAKTWAYAVGSAIMGVHTMDALADRAGATTAPLWAIMDAQRQELYAARFVPGTGGVRDSGATRIVTQADWLAMLRPGDAVTGPPLAKLRPRLPVGVEAMPEAVWQPTASSVGRVAWQQHQSGRRDDLWKLVPLYIRPSAAEEKLLTGGTGSLLASNER